MVLEEMHETLFLVRAYSVLLAFLVSFLFELALESVLHSALVTFS